jgi:hypothetical protein
MRKGLNAALVRVVAVIAGLLLIGIILRLLLAILQPVLPDLLLHDVMASWNLLYSIVSPAMPPILAVGILCALCWIIVGKRG